jgi:DNA repair protein RadC
VLSDAELLAIFLRTGVSGKTAVDLARELLQTYGGLRALLEADRARFCAMHGLGIAKYAQLQAVLEMARRHLAEQLQRADPLENPDVTRRYLASRLRHLPHEIFACLFLDNRHRVIIFEELFRGTIDGASVHPREVVKRALHHNAAAVILAHNHPSGVAEPSRADIQLTRRLVDALARWPRAGTSSGEGAQRAAGACKPGAADLKHQSKRGRRDGDPAAGHAGCALALGISRAGTSSSGRVTACRWPSRLPLPGAATTRHCCRSTVPPAAIP